MNAPHDIVADSVLALVLSTFFALLWALAALHKALDWTVYREQVNDYRVLPEDAINVVAILLPLLEAGLAVAWLFRASQISAIAISVVLLLLYAGAMAYNLQRGRNSIDCGCGGNGQSIRWGLVVRNLLLALTALALSGADRDNSRVLIWMDWITIVGGTLAVYGFYIVCNQMLANNPPQRSVH